MRAQSGHQYRVVLLHRFTPKLTSYWLSIDHRLRFMVTKLNYFRNIFLKGATRVSLLALAKSK